MTSRPHGTRATSLLTASALALAATGAIAGACSSNSAGGPPAGTTPFTDSGLIGCLSVNQGCFTTGGAAYETPSTTATCSPSGGPTSGPPDDHCQGEAAQAVTPASCHAGPMDSGMRDAGAPKDAGLPPGPCGENADYGMTMYGHEADDDDCKYHVSYTSTPICENDGTYFIVTANYLTRDHAPLSGACTFAELCLNDEHPAPNVDQSPSTGSQLVVEGPPGTYTVGPVVFDAPGDWTVRFHFNAECCDVVDDSPHGHAAFHVTVP
jgi:hypothetical protein